MNLRPDRKCHGKLPAPYFWHILTRFDSAGNSTVISIAQDTSESCYLKQATQTRKGRYDVKVPAPARTSARADVGNGRRPVSAIPRGSPTARAREGAVAAAGRQSRRNPGPSPCHPHRRRHRGCRRRNFTRTPHLADTASETRSHPVGNRWPGSVPAGWPGP